MPVRYQIANSRIFSGLIAGLILSFVPITEASGQLVVYAGNGYQLTHQVLHMANGRLFPAYSFDFRDVRYTVIRNEIMTGSSGSEFDLIYTYRDGKVYNGNAMYSSQIAYTFDNGKIYRGDSTFELDVLYNVRNGVIYNGSQSFITDALYYIDGNFTIPELFGVLLSLDLIE